MKKYYYPLKIIVLLVLLGFFITPVEASIVTSSASPSKIYKCGESIIAATFTDGGITTVSAILTSKNAVLPMIPGSGRILSETQTTTISLAYNGTYWVGTFGNDASLLWGSRSITYLIDGVTSYPSSTDVFVYSDACVGTGIISYTQIPTGLGRYTKMLYSGQFSLIGSSLETSFIGWALYPWVEYWGYLFYMFILFTIVSVIYMKTQNVVQPIMVGLAFLLIFAGTTQIIPNNYKQFVLFIIAAAMAAIYYRTFTRD